MTGRSRSSRGLAGALLAAVLAVSAGCTVATSPAAGDWQRSYLRPRGAVWQAALETLADLGYAVEQSDEGAGRIVARSAAAPSYRTVSLDIALVRAGDAIRVDVQISGGAAGWRGEPGGASGLVGEFLAELDRRLVH